MILAEPPPGQGDIHFRVFGIPVRVHPFFWLIAVLLVIRSDPKPAQVLIWIAAMFVSILIHELGHAWLQRHYGGRPRIVLYVMGGLAISEYGNRSSRAQILISLAGPMAGFAFAAVLLLLVRLVGHRAGIAFHGESDALLGSIPLSMLGLTFYWEAFQSPHLNTALWYLLQVNILWGIINLLPIYPLDGGQVSREVCQLHDPSGGIDLSLQISMITAVVMALVGISWGSFFTLVMFGYFAYSSYRMLQAYRGSRW